VATQIVLKGSGLVESAVRVVDAATTRATELIATSRTEVREASETVAVIGVRAEANGPILNALSERLETTLAPRIAEVQDALIPVRDALATIGNILNLMSSLPMISDRAPRLVGLNEIFQRIEGMSADTTQLRSTLRALAAGQPNNLSAETVATVNGLAQRIDARLGEVQGNVHDMHEDIAALQVRLDKRKSQLLVLFNLLALFATVMFVWIGYSQLVVIRHHRSGRQAREESR
jgi:cob(I)alamin adenosyltransferase